jgi:hypothetical protein
VLQRALNPQFHALLSKASNRQVSQLNLSFPIKNFLMHKFLCQLQKKKLHCDIACNFDDGQHSLLHFTLQIIAIYKSRAKSSIQLCSIHSRLHCSVKYIVNICSELKCTRRPFFVVSVAILFFSATSKR